MVFLAIELLIGFEVIGMQLNPLCTHWNNMDFEIFKYWEVEEFIVTRTRKRFQFLVIHTHLDKQSILSARVWLIAMKGTAITMFPGQMKDIERNLHLPKLHDRLMVDIHVRVHRNSKAKI